MLERVRPLDVEGVDNMEKFVIDYALYKMQTTVNNPLIQACYKVQKLNDVSRALSLYNQEIITTDEAIKMILEA